MFRLPRQLLSEIFFILISIRRDTVKFSAPSENEYQEKGGRYVKLTTSPPSYAECHEIWEPKPPETLWTTPGPLRDCFKFYCHKFLKFFTQSARYSCQILMKFWVYLHEKHLIIKFHKNLSRCSIRMDGRMERHDEANSPFLKLCERA